MRDGSAANPDFYGANLATLFSTLNISLCRKALSRRQRIIKLYQDIEDTPSNDRICQPNLSSL
jgi:hypothetical protein